VVRRAVLDLIRKLADAEQEGQRTPAAGNSGAARS
jgi:hypothetical protein